MERVVPGRTIGERLLQLVLRIGLFPLMLVLVWSPVRDTRRDLVVMLVPVSPVHVSDVLLPVSDVSDGGVALTQLVVGLMLRVAFLMMLRVALPVPFLMIRSVALMLLRRTRRALGRSRCVLGIVVRRTRCVLGIVARRGGRRLGVGLRSRIVPFIHPPRSRLGKDGGGSGLRESLR